MSLPNAATASRLSRRDLFALGAALVLPAACADRRSIRDVNVATLEPEQVLLLGRVRITILGEDRTADTFIRTTASDDERLLPPDGEVAWAVRRPLRSHLVLCDVRSLHHTLHGGLCILAPAQVVAPIVYFGTVRLELVRDLTSNRRSPRVGQLGKDIVDDHERDMEAFVMENPGLAGRRYYNVLRGAFFEAPPVTAAPLGLAPPG